MFDSRPEIVLSMSGLDDVTFCCDVVAIPLSRENIQDLVFDDVHSARPVHQMTLLAGIYTISAGSVGVA